MGIIEKWNIFAKKTIYINSSHQITAGRFIMVLLVTFVQFIAMWCANSWILNDAMFFLLANFLLGIGKREEDTK